MLLVTTIQGGKGFVTFTDRKKVHKMKLRFEKFCLRYIGAKWTIA